MLKSEAISLLAPQVSSVSTTPVRKSVPATQIKTRSKAKAKLAIKNPFRNLDIVPIVTIGAVATMLFLLVMHVVWINVYSSKGFTLKNLQASIDEQTTQQKKLLIQQSLLTSSLSIGEAGQHGLVPVTDVEYLAGNSLAQAK